MDLIFFDIYKNEGEEKVKVNSKTLKKVNIGKIPKIIFPSIVFPTLIEQKSVRMIWVDTLL